MLGEPIMPVLIDLDDDDRETEMMAKHTAFLDDTMEVSGKYVMVAVDAASWHAMVERAAEADYGKGWEHTKLQPNYRSACAKLLRIALNLPDGWTP